MLILAVLAFAALTALAAMLSASLADIFNRSHKGSGSSFSVLFLLFVSTDDLYSHILYKLFICAAAAACCYFSFSNHFVVSLDILFLFSSLIVILFHHIKVAHNTPAGLTA